MTLSRNPRCSREETRARILDRADELFEKFGFDRVTVADVAAELQMSPANVYKHFVSKAALVEACADRCCNEFRTTFDIAARSRGRVVERIEKVILSYYRLNLKNLSRETELYKIVLAAHKENWSCVRNVREALIKVLIDLIEEGMRQGEFRPLDSLQTAKVLFDSTIWVTHGVLFYELNRDEVESRLHSQVQFFEQAMKILK